MITQTLNYLFMKKILSYLYFGVPELCSRNHLIFLRYIMFLDSAPHDNCMFSIHEKSIIQETTAMAASISLVEQALHSSYIYIHIMCVCFVPTRTQQTNMQHNIGVEVVINDSKVIQPLIHPILAS